MRLKGKVAIVTGGARGLGKAYALRLCEEGAKLVIADILDATKVVQSIAKEKGEVLALYTDVSQEESTKEMARKTIEYFGRIDILIDNAAIATTTVMKPFCEISAEEWDEVIRVNLKGLFLCCKAVYPQMKKQVKGKIINISSGTFFKGLPYFIHYVTSKGGIIGWSLRFNWTQRRKTYPPRQPYEARLMILPDELRAGAWPAQMRAVRYQLQCCNE